MRYLLLIISCIFGCQLSLSAMGSTAVAVRQFNHCDNVDLWLLNPSDRLNEPEYCNIGKWNQWKQEVLHTFPCVIEAELYQYASEIAFKVIHKNVEKDDKMLCFVGAIDFSTSPRDCNFQSGTIYGVFSVSYDPHTGYIYHRYFNWYQFAPNGEPVAMPCDTVVKKLGPQQTIELKNALKMCHNKNEFPPIGGYPVIAQREVRDVRGKTLITESADFVRILDPVTQVTYIISKQQPITSAN